MRVFACKDLDGVVRVIGSESEPVNPKWFQCLGSYCCLLRDSAAIPYCRTLAPGTFRELKKLDVVSGEYEFVEEVKVPTLREAWEAMKEVFPNFLDGELTVVKNMQDALDREASKPAPRYDEKLIDELLEINYVSENFYMLLMPGRSWVNPSNRRAAEILQALKRAKQNQTL